MFSIVFATVILPLPLIGDGTMRFFLLFLLAPMAAVALDLTEQQRADIEARIQPFSAVCVQGETCGGGEAMADAAGRSGEDVYNGACMA